MEYELKGPLWMNLDIVENISDFIKSRKKYPAFYYDKRFKKEVQDFFEKYEFNFNENLNAGEKTLTLTEEDIALMKLILGNKVIITGI